MCRLLPFWSSVFLETEWSVRPVLQLRSPLEVALSLNRRDGIALSRGCLIWLRHVLDAEAETRRMRRAVLDWTNFLADRRGALEQLSVQLGLAWPRWTDSSLAEVDEFVSGDLRRERASEDDLRVHPAVNDLVRDTYAAMIELVEDPSKGRIWRKLDDARTRFEDAAAIFGQAMFETEEESRGFQSLARHDREVAAQSSAARDEFASQFAAERDNFGSQLAAERDNFASKFAAERDDFASRLAAVRGEHAALLAERDARLVERDARLAENSALLAERDARLGEKDVLIAHKDRLIAEREREIGRTEAALADRDREMARMQSEREEAQAALAAAGSEAKRLISRLSEDRDFLARSLSRTYHRPWRPLKHRLNYHLLRSFSALTAPFSERTASWLARSAQKRNPSRFDTYLLAADPVPTIASAPPGSHVAENEPGFRVPVTASTGSGGAPDSPAPANAEGPQDAKEQAPALFDGNYYLECYSDVAKAGVDPYWHFVHYGWRQGLNPNEFFDLSWYLRTTPRRPGRRPAEALYRIWVEGRP